MRIKIKIKKSKTFLTLLMTMLICCSIFISTRNIVNSATTDSSGEVDEEATEKIDEKKKEEERLEKMIELKQKQQNTLKNQLEIMEVNETRIENNVQSTKNEIESKENAINNLRDDINETEKEISKTKDGLGEMLRTYDKIEREITLSMLSSKGSLAEVFNHSEYLNQASQDLEKALKDIKNKREELNEERYELEDKKKELEEDESNLEEELNNLSNQKKSKSYLLTKTKGEETKYQKLLTDIQDEIYDLESGKTVDYGNIPASKNGYFDYPVSSVKITQGYGMTSYAKSGAYGGSAHNGIDFGLKYENIFAVQDGKVKATGNNGGYAYGKWIAIDHGDGLITLYGHLSNLKVSRGDKVDKGDKIAVSGNTGYSTGPHLHFSVFDAKSFELSESSYVNGLMIPTGASINPNRYF